MKRCNVIDVICEFHEYGWIITYNEASKMKPKGICITFNWEDYEGDEPTNALSTLALYDSSNLEDTSEFRPTREAYRNSIHYFDVAEGSDMLHRKHEGHRYCNYILHDSVEHIKYDIVCFMVVAMRPASNYSSIDEVGDFGEKGVKAMIDIMDKRDSP